jgi:hypothetical protein
VPPSSVLLSGPGCCSPGRRLPAKASSRHQWSGVVAVVGTAGTPAMASVSGPRPACSVHPSRFVVGIRRSSRPVSSPSGVQPVRCPARPVSGHLGSSSGVQRSDRSVSSRPVSDRLVSSRLASARPASRRLVSTPSVRTRLSCPTSDGGVGTGRCGGIRYHRNGSSPGGLPRRRAARSTAEGAWTRATLAGRALVSGGWWRIRTGPGSGSGRRRPRVTG